MQIVVPEDLGTELKKMEGVAKATIDAIMPGKSKSGQPKATVRYVIIDDSDVTIKGSDEPAVGEPVLETFSLQPQALWKLNRLYKEVTKERLPQGDFSPEEFFAMLEENLIGKEFSLVLNLQIPNDGSSTEERTEVTERTYIGG